MSQLLDDTPPTCRVIDAKLQHAPTIAGFNAAMARETENLELDSERLLAGVRGVFEKPERGFYLAALRNDEVVGCLLVTAEWSDWRNGTFWWIQSVYVAPLHRGSAVFRSLYREVVERARLRGDVCGIRLYVERENTRAQAVYRALGMDDSGYRVFGWMLP